MNILIFIPCYTHGGAEGQAMILAEHLLSQGHKVDVLAFPSPNDTGSVKAGLFSKGIACHELPAWPQLNWSGVARFPSPWQFLSWRRQLRRYSSSFSDTKFDAVIPFTFWPSLVTSLFRSKFGTPIVIWNHRGGNDAAGIEYTPFLIDSIRKSRPIFLANSTAGRTFLEDTFTLKSDAVKIIPNFVPSYVGVEAATDFLSSFEEDTCQLLQIANQFPEKDFETLLDAMSLIKHSDIKCHLHLAGNFPSPELIHEFNLKLRGRNLCGCVTHYGPLAPSQIKRLLEIADIGILSSRSEGCPNSVMEYMLFGLPVVGTRISGIRDLVGEAGIDYLFPVGDALQLRDRVYQLAINPSLRVRVGFDNQRRLMKIFGTESILSRWSDILKPLATQR